LDETEEEAGSTTFGALGAGAAATVFFTGVSDKAAGVSTWFGWRRAVARNKEWISVNESKL
jgi:hypothetical protein